MIGDITAALSEYPDNAAWLILGKGLTAWRWSLGTGFLLLYKRFEDGRMSWPRNTEQAAELTEEQYRYLMLGLNPLDPRIKDINPSKIC